MRKMSEFRAKKPIKPSLNPSSPGILRANLLLAANLILVLLVSSIVSYGISRTSFPSRLAEHAMLTAHLSFYVSLLSLSLLHILRPHYADFSRRVRSLSTRRTRQHRSHISHMRLDRFYRLPGYRFSPVSFLDLCSSFSGLCDALFMPPAWSLHWIPFTVPQACRRVHQAADPGDLRALYIRGLLSGQSLRLECDLETTVSDLYSTVYKLFPGLHRHSEQIYMTLGRSYIPEISPVTDFRRLSSIGALTGTTIVIRYRVRGGCSQDAGSRDKRPFDVIDISDSEGNPVPKKPRLRSKYLNTRPGDAVETIYISSDSDHDSSPPLSHHQHHAVKSEVIDVDLISDDSDTPRPGPSHALPNRTVKTPTIKRPQSHRSKGKGKVADVDRSLCLTSRLVVDVVEHVSEAWECWTVPKSQHVAYILDLNNNPTCLIPSQSSKASSSKGADGSRLTVDAFIKREVFGRFFGYDYRVLNIPAVSGLMGWTYGTVVESMQRISTESQVRERSEMSGIISYMSRLLYMLGVHETSLSEFERWSPDDQTRDDMFTSPVFEAHSREATSPVARARAFYQSVVKVTCSAKLLDGSRCDGEAIMRTFKDGPKRGKKLFIGCADWQENDSKAGINHRFTAIRSDVSEGLLQRLFLGQDIGNHVNTEDVHGHAKSCPTILHPNHLPKGKRCKLTHVDEAGNVITGQLRHHPCPARLTVYIPLDETDCRAVIVPRTDEPHHHPVFPPMKTPHAVEEKYKDCIRNFGSTGTTTLRVDKAAGTRTALDGQIPQELHPSLINNRRRRDLLRQIKTEQAPLGRDIYGVLHQLQQDHANGRSAKERYIQSVNILTDATHIIVTVDPSLALLAHKARWIMVDTTFKVVHGKTNQWKLVIWLDDLMKRKSMTVRVVIGRVWCNRATRTAFRYIWGNTFDAIADITGRQLTFHIFSSRSRLLCAIGDSEGAQAQGFGDTIISRQMHIFPGSPYAGMSTDTLLMYLWKTCLVHFERGVLNIQAYLPEETFIYLRTFPYIETDEEHRNYVTFCEAPAQQQIPKLRDWWAHKKSYPWLLPSLCPHLSLMSRAHWDQTPNDTNPIEGSHAYDNKMNDTKHSLLDAVLTAGEMDQREGRIILAAVNSGILPNAHNTQENRYSLQATRKASARQKARETEEYDERMSEIRAQEKALKAQKKALAEARRSATSSPTPTGRRTQSVATPTRRPPSAAAAASGKWSPGYMSGIAAE